MSTFSTKWLEALGLIDAPTSPTPQVKESKGPAELRELQVTQLVLHPKAAREGRNGLNHRC